MIASTANLNVIGDFVEDEILVVDKEHHVKFANSIMQLRSPQHSRVPPGGYCYKVFQNREWPCGPPLWECPLPKMLKSGCHTVLTYHEGSPTGKVASGRRIKITFYPIKDSLGNIDSVVEIRRDITAETRLEEHLLRSHDHLYALNRVSSAVSGLRDLDAMLSISLDTVLEIMNGAIGGILLVDEETGKLYYRVYRGLSSQYAESMRMGLGEGIAGKVAQSGEPFVSADISREPEAVHPDLVSTEGLKGFVSVPLKAREKVVGVMNIASHLSGQFQSDDVYLLSSIGSQVGIAIEQAALYNRLDDARKRYRLLLQHTLSAQEEERKRIARELHDETSQTLTSLTLNLQAVAEMLAMRGVADAALSERLNKMQSLTAHATGEIVRLMRELRPSLLDDLGLAAAVNRYTRDTLEPHGIRVTTDFTGVDRRFFKEVEITLFRITQGVVGNILEHSRAKNASVKLECNDDECVLHIEDDGQGFDAGKLTRVDNRGRGAGLFTIKERARLAGGSCRVYSQPGQGTRISVQVPLKGELPDSPA